MKLKLIVLAGAKEGLEIPLKKDKFLIGRAKECALRAGSEAISRRHCAIIRRESGYTVRDLGSRNGTLVNDEKISSEVPLKDVGDVVERTISNSDSATEEDVSRWLLNMTSDMVADTLKETRSMRAEETST